jgi:TBC1 domain family member 20
MDEGEPEKLLHGIDLEQSIYTDAKETTEEFEAKRRDIESACQRHDVKALAEHAVSPGGLLTDNLRRVACTCFLS